RIDVTRACGQHQRASTERELLVGIGTALEQCLDYGGITARRCQPQWCRAIVIGETGIGAGLQQLPDQSRISAIGGPVQRSGAITLWFIDVGAALQQTLDFLAVA